MKQKVKKWTGGLLLCFLILAVAKATLGEKDKPITKAHVYKVLPGTEEWNAMTPKERTKSCYVSREEAAAMTTDALVETVLTYPFLINIHAYDSLTYGIEEVKGYFPPLEELLTRKDAWKALREYGKDLPEENAEERLRQFDVNVLCRYIDGDLESS